MKKLLFILLFISFFNCDQSDPYIPSGDYHTIKYLIAGDAPAIRVNDTELYQGLSLSIDYEKSEALYISPGQQKIVSFFVEKLTNDATTVTASIYIDDILEISDTSTDPYATIALSYLYTP